MNIKYTEVVKRPALLQRLTGLNVKEFETLLEPFSHQYDQLVIQPRVSAPSRKRALGGGQKGALPDVTDKLLFILVYTRIYPLLIIQGMFFGMAESKACTWVGTLLGICWMQPWEKSMFALSEPRDGLWKKLLKSFPNSKNWEC